MMAGIDVDERLRLVGDRQFRRILAFLELPTAVLGIWVGGTDLFSAPWLPARILGVLLFLLGILVLSGQIACYRKQTDNRMRLILSGAVAGVVIDSVFMLSSFHYNKLRFALFALCALPCAVLAWRVFSWSLIKPYRKSAALGAILGAVVAIVPFLYTSIYLPTTADVAIQSTLATGAPEAVRPNADLLDLKVTLQDKSAIRAVALTSMVEVYGVNYSGKKAHFESQPSQARSIQVGSENTIVPNLEFSGTRHSVLVTTQRLIDDGSFVYPDTSYTIGVPVLIPAGKYQELDVELTLWYARSDRLELTGKYFEGVEPERYCANDFLSAWFITQPLLSRLTHGIETVVTDWCASIRDLKTRSFIGAAPRKISDLTRRNTSDQISRLEAATYQIRHTSRRWIIVLPEKYHHHGSFSLPDKGSD